MERLDVILRFHDLQRSEELNRCIFSLVTQDYAPVAINLVTQRFTDDDLEALDQSLRPLMRLASGVTLHIFNYVEARPEDARSALLNIGISNCTGRYLAFLDHDDTIYPEAYRQLIEQLSKTSAVISFGTVAVKTREVFDDLLLVTSRKNPYRHRNLSNLFRENFCPPNSYVINRERIDPADLYFPADWNRLEDYHFLIRICAKYPSDFQLVGTVIGDSYVKTDGSNTTLTPFHQSNQMIAEWAQARQAIDVIKAATPVSADVQRLLGLAVDPALTVADLIARES